MARVKWEIDADLDSKLVVWCRADWNDQWMIFEEEDGLCSAVENNWEQKQIAE